MDCTLQEVPFHTSARVTTVPVPLLEELTHSQNVAEAHDTDPKLLMKPPVGLGKGCALQDVPFHMAAPALEPTASQKLAETHDTVPTPTDGGRACSCHDLPFHCSAAGALSGLLTTASQKCAETHDTPLSSASVEPAGPGVSCGRHEAPFHTSASGTRAAELVLLKPTASQNVADRHDTLPSPAVVTPAGLGTGCNFQECPRHTSASMTPVDGLPVL